MEDTNRTLEEQIRARCKRTSDALDQRIVNDLAEKLNQQRPIKPAPAPAGIWRMIMGSKRIKLAAAAVVALGVLLPVSYAAVEAVMKYFTVQDPVSLEVQGPGYDVAFNGSRNVTVGGTNISTEGQARVGLEEFRQLYSEGKAKEIEPGVWQATLANGELFHYRGDPQQAAHEVEEVNALRKAGKGERTLIKETEENGVKTRIYEVHYKLSSGREVVHIETQPGDSGGGSIPLRRKDVSGAGSTPDK